MKFFICVILIFMLAVFPVGATQIASEYQNAEIFEPLPELIETAAPIGQVLELNAKSVILLEANSKQILYESNSDERLKPASITKIMSLLLVCEAIENGSLTLETQITASPYACSMGGSQIWLEPDEIMTVDELLKACFIASANDATVALAEAVAGSEEAFVSLMNERAKQLGLNGTNFVNTTGLDAEGHLTNAHDVAIMSAELISHELVKKYSTVWMDSLRQGESELVNTNKLVRFYEGCTGLKTGTTSGAGYCVSATAERDGLSLVAVVMCADSSNNRFDDARKLLNYGFANYKYTTVDCSDIGEIKVPVLSGTAGSVLVVPDGNLNILLKKSNMGAITKSVSVPENVTAPIMAGDTVGCVYVNVGEEQVGVIELKAEQSVEKLTLKFIFKTLLRALFTL